MTRWLEFVSMFPELTPQDLAALLYPQFRMKRYAIHDKSKLVALIKETWSTGLMTWSEVRDELGLLSVNPDERCRRMEGRQKAPRLAGVARRR